MNDRWKILDPLQWRNVKDTIEELDFKNPEVKKLFVREYGQEFWEFKFNTEVKKIKEYIDDYLKEEAEFNAKEQLQEKEVKKQKKIEKKAAEKKIAFAKAKNRNVGEERKFAVEMELLVTTANHLQRERGLNYANIKK